MSLQPRDIPTNGPWFPYLQYSFDLQDPRPPAVESVCTSQKSMSTCTNCPHRFPAPRNLVVSTTEGIAPLAGDWTAGELTYA